MSINDLMRQLERDMEAISSGEMPIEKAREVVAQRKMLLQNIEHAIEHAKKEKKKQ